MQNLHTLSQKNNFTNQSSSAFFVRLMHRQRWSKDKSASTPSNVLKGSACVLKKTIIPMLLKINLYSKKTNGA
jgi:hypothetical protein